MAKKSAKRVNPEPGVTVFQRTYRNAAGELVATSTWTARIWIRGHEHKIPTKFRDQSAAVRWALDQRSKLERRAAGQEDFDDAGETPVKELVTEFRRMLEGQKLSVSHVERTDAMLRAMLKGVRSLAEVTPQKVRERLREIEATPAEGLRGHHKRQRSAKALNRYRWALGAFFKWLVEEDRWAQNPVAKVKAAKEGDTDADRALRLEEARALLLAETTRPERRAVYALAIMTGLRKGEINALLWRDLDLESGHVTIRKSVEKARRGAVLPLRPLTAHLLRELRAGRAAGTPGYVPCSRPKVKPGWQPDEHVARCPEVRTLHNDLEAAVPGIQDLDKIGFHSLRRTTNTGMKDLGVSAATRKEVMRHATLELTTSQSYTTIWEADLVRAYDLLEQAVLVAPGASPGPTTGPISSRRGSIESGRIGSVRGREVTTTEAPPRGGAGDQPESDPANAERLKA